MRGARTVDVDIVYVSAYIGMYVYIEVLQRICSYYVHFMSVCSILVFCTALYTHLL